MSRVETALNRLRESGARVASMDSPYPLSAPSLEPGCQEAEIQELEGVWPLPQDYP
jgi:hypothetical protein